MAIIIDSFSFGKNTVSLVFKKVVCGVETTQSKSGSIRFARNLANEMTILADMQ